ncbi:MAG: hypothetical protein RLZZ628_3887 [Bacteroidota bacterium]|jgi:hypothetical protein
MLKIQHKIQKNRAVSFLGYFWIRIDVRILRISPIRTDFLEFMLETQAKKQKKIRMNR